MPAEWGRVDLAVEVVGEDVEHGVEVGSEVSEADPELCVERL
jgi:hypothetical protein